MAAGDCLRRSSLPPVNLAEQDGSLSEFGRSIILTFFPQQASHPSGSVEYYDRLTPRLRLQILHSVTTMMHSSSSSSSVTVFAHFLHKLGPRQHRGTRTVRILYCSESVVLYSTRTIAGFHFRPSLAVHHSQQT